MKVTSGYRKDLLRLGTLIKERAEKYNWGVLCNFGDFLDEPVEDLSEKEWLVAQVVPRAARSLEKLGDPFAIKGHHGDFAMETVAEDYLVERGYLLLEKRTIEEEEKDVLLPTEKLLVALKKYFGREF